MANKTLSSMNIKTVARIHNTSIVVGTEYTMIAGILLSSSAVTEPSVSALKLVVAGTSVAKSCLGSVVVIAVAVAAWNLVSVVWVGGGVGSSSVAQSLRLIELEPRQRAKELYTSSLSSVRMLLLAARTVPFGDSTLHQYCPMSSSLTGEMDNRDETLTNSTSPYDEL